MELARRTTTNSLYSLLGFVWPIALAIVATPYLVNRLGDDAYGLYALGIAAVGFLGLLDLGMGSAVMKFVSELVATRDVRGLNSALRAGLAFYIATGVLGLVAVVAMTPFLVERVLDLPVGLRDAARTVFYVTAGTFLFTMLVSFLSAIPASVHRFDITAKVNSVYATATIGAACLLVALGYGVQAIVVANLVVTAAGATAYGVIAPHLVPVRRGASLDLSMLRRMSSFASLTLVATVSGTILVQLDKFVIGSVLGVALVTYYVIPANLAIRLHAAAAQLAVVLFPVASELYALGERERVHRLYVRATRLVVAFVVAAAIPLLSFASQILEVWISPEFAARSADVFVLLIITNGVLALTAVPFYVALGANRPSVNAVFSLVSAVLNVVFMIFLIPRYGLIGAAVAYLASLIAVPFFILFVERRVLGTSSAAWVGCVARIAPAAFVQAAACELLLGPAVSGVATLLLALAVGFVLFPLVYLLPGLAHPDDRDLLRSLSRRVVTTR